MLEAFKGHRRDHIVTEEPLNTLRITGLMVISILAIIGVAFALLILDQ